MPDVATQLAERVTEMERRLDFLERSPQLQSSTVKGGNLTIRPLQGPAALRLGGDTDDENVEFSVTDTDGNKDISVGTDSDGHSFIRVMNGDGSAPVFEVTDGVGTFPLTTSAWQRDYEYSGQDVAGRSSTTSAVFTFGWHVVLSLVTPRVQYSFMPFTYAGVTQGQLRFSVHALGPRGAPGSVVVGSTHTFDTSYPNVQAGTLTIPPTVLLPQYTDVVGNVVTIAAEFRVSGGTGTVAIAPTEPAYCV